MKPVVRILLPAMVAQMLLFPPFAVAEDEVAVPNEREIMQSEGPPPLVPHAIPAPDKNGKLTCLSCHEDGKSKTAPPTSHPDRKMCIQCHIQGEITKTVIKGKKK